MVLLPEAPVFLVGYIDPLQPTVVYGELFYLFDIVFDFLFVLISRGSLCFAVHWLAHIAYCVSGAVLKQPGY